jgi:hypothetical protein
MSRESRRWRTGLLLACGFVAILVLYLHLSCTPLLPWCASTVGMSVEYGPSTSYLVTTVKPRGPAAQVGLRSGDRIDRREVSFATRWWLEAIRNSYSLPVGERLRVAAHRDDQVFDSTIVAQKGLSTWEIAWQLWAQDLGLLWCIAFAAVLASRRPDLVEARLLSLILICFAMGPLTDMGLVPWPLVDFLIYSLGAVVLFRAAPVALFVILTAQFAPPLSRVRTFLIVATLGFLLLGLASDEAQQIFLFLLPLRTQSMDIVLGYAYGIAFFLSALSGVAAFIAAKGSERTRVGWITAFIAPLWVGFAVLFIAEPSGSATSFLNIALFAFSWIMPAGLTYAVLARRCLDIGYVLNRAAVFGALSTLVLGVFILVEWALGEWVTDISRTTGTIVNLSVALALGLSIRYAHRRVEYVVDRVFFRKRHEDEVALRRFASESEFITDRETVLDRTVDVITRHADAGGVQILGLDGDGRYMFLRGPQDASVSENDPALLALMTRHDPIDLHVYETVIRGERAFPMVVRGQLLGALICDAKQNGEAYAPDESEAIGAIAHSVGAALSARPRKDSDAQLRLLEIQERLLEEVRLLRLELKASSRQAIPGD